MEIDNVCLQLLNMHSSMIAVLWSTSENRFINPIKSRYMNHKSYNWSFKSVELAIGAINMDYIMKKSGLVNFKHYFNSTLAII